MINIYKYFVYTAFLALFFSSFGSAQSLSELKKMQDEYKNLKESENPLSKDGSDFDFNKSISGSPSRAEVSPYSGSEVDSQNLKTLHFGYDFFTKRDTVAFWENLPTPPKYLLGPGDELVLSMWGQTQLRQNYTISREGKIYDEKVGLLNLTGRTIDEAYDYLKIQFGRIYSTLNGKNPTSFIDVSLGKLRSINVNFVGQVKFPGVYPIHPFSSLITGLIQSGGVDTTGSLRNIIIKREGKVFSSVDLYEFFLYGELSSSIQLRDQDIVIVPSRKSIITIDSAVVRPGFYEALPDESIYDLIQHAGGPTYDASNQVGIRRIKPILERENGSAYEGFYVDYYKSKLLSTSMGDHITLHRLFKESQEVEIIGQVKVPGVYIFYKGMSLQRLLALSGGFEDSTYIKSIYLTDVQIIRRDPNSRYEKIISLNLKEILNKDTEETIFLENLDKVIVHANLNFFEKKNVLISGEINIPGSYPLIKDNESLEALLKRAGGLTSKALDNGIEIYRENTYLTKEDNTRDFFPQEKDYSETRDVSFESTNKIEPDKSQKIRVAWKNTNISLMPGDSVVVKEKSFTVFVMGSVYNPGVLEFRDGKSLRYYLNAAGGLTDLGNEKGIIVLYPNGLVSPKKWYSSPKIVDGTTIMVSRKRPEDPFDITQFATNWTSTISSMITVIVLSRTL